MVDHSMLVLADTLHIRTFDQGEEVPSVVIRLVHHSAGSASTFRVTSEPLNERRVEDQCRIDVHKSCKRGPVTAEPS
jgi:hypothetical protein